MKILRDITYGNEPGQVIDAFLPDGGEETRALFLYFHGGGLAGGSRRGAEKKLAPLLTSSGIALASADYRMYPGAKYPDYIEDAASASALCMKKAGELCGGRLYIGGSSAGAFLTMMLCFDREFLGRHGIDPCDVAGFVHDSGQPTCHFRELKERGLDPRRVIVDERAPLYYVGLAEKLPPMAFLYADRDMTNRPEQTEVMLTALRHFGYDMTRTVSMKLRGTHCQSGKMTDAEGNNMLASIIRGFILRTEEIHRGE